MLDTLVFSHPFPALIAFFIAIGLFNLGIFLASKYYKKVPSLIESVSISKLHILSISSLDKTVS